ncbi:MAG: phosphoribosylanthranilate isomerase [Pseudomonadota bacterium]
MRVRTKICGLTTADDAAAAVAAGADAIGLVFHDPSPRAVDPEAAAAIVAALPPFVTVVGLFVDPEPAAVEAVLQRVPLDRLQFHGDEPAALCTAFGRPYIKAVRMRADTDPAAVMAAHPAASGFLLDAWRPDRAGGTGEAFDWDRVPSRRPRPLILAGGLAPDNVAAAVARVAPWAVDVSSGVESLPGRKDPARMQAFINEVQRGTTD